MSFAALGQQDSRQRRHLDAAKLRLCEGLCGEVCGFLGGAGWGTQGAWAEAVCQMV